MDTPDTEAAKIHKRQCENLSYGEKSQPSLAVPGTSSSRVEVSVIHSNTDVPASASYDTDHTRGEPNVSMTMLNVDEEIEKFNKLVNSNVNESSSDIRSATSTLTTEKCETRVKNTKKIDFSFKNKCFFCKAPFRSGLKVMHIVLTKPLPSSLLEPLSLLECFGMPIPSLCKGDREGFSLVDVCGMCYVVLSDCDVLYPHLHSVISKIREVWPDRVKGKKTLCLNVLFLDSKDDKNRLSSGKHTSKKRVCSKSFVPDLQFSFIYSKKPHLIPKSCKQFNRKNSGGNGETAIRTLDPDGMSNKVSVEDIFTCGFCGETFCSEQDWQTHLTTSHKIVRKWQSYDLQLVLKRLISKEVCRNDDSRGKRSQIGKRNYLGKRNCKACDRDFNSRDEFVCHLQEFHNINKKSYETISNYDRIDSPPKGQYQSELEALETDSISGSLSDGSAGDIDDYDDDAENETQLCRALKESSMESTGEFSHEAKDEPQTRKANERDRNQHMKELEYLVVLKNDGQGSVTDCRIKLREESEEIREPHKSKVSDGNLEQGEEEVEDDKSIICGMCGEEFGSCILIAEHNCPGHAKVDKSGSDEVVFIECSVCNRRLLGKHALRAHITQAHGYRRPGIRNHKCKMCNFLTQARGDLNKHMKEEHRVNTNPPVKCFVCGKKYSAKYIGKHISVIHGTLENKKYSCKFCDMKYHDSSYLRAHIYKEHANRKWKCQICDLEFEKYHRLLTHKTNVHSTVVHKCADCEKTYKRKGELTVHRKRCHETRKRIMCGYCSKSFLEVSKFRNHLMTFHEVPWENTLSPRYARHQQENNCLQKRSSKLLKLDCDENTKSIRAPKRPRKTELHSSDSSSESEESEDNMDLSDQHGYSGSRRVQYNPQGNFDSSKGNVSSYTNDDVNQQAQYSVIEITETEDNVVNIGAMTSSIDYSIHGMWHE